MIVTKDISDPSGLETLNVIGNANKFNRWMYTTIQPFCHGEILEIGSGTGNISDFFLADGYNIRLSDIREEYCEYFHDKYKNNPNFRGISQLNLADDNFDVAHSGLLGKFDTVFSLNVLEHIDDHYTAVANANKLLKPGGRLITLVPAYPVLFCRFDQELGHFRRYTRKSLKQVFSDNGNKTEKIFHFNLAGIGGWLIFGKLFGSKQINHGEMNLFNRLVPVFKFFDLISFRRLGLSIIIVASKPVA